MREKMIMKNEKNIVELFASENGKELYGIIGTGARVCRRMKKRLASIHIHLLTMV